MKRTFFIFLSFALFSNYSAASAGAAPPGPPPRTIDRPAQSASPTTTLPSLPSSALPAAPAPAISPEEQALFDQAKSLFEQSNDDALLPVLEQFLLKFPNSPLLPTVYFQMGLLHVRKGDPKRAVEIFKTVLDKFPAFDRMNDVRSQLSDIYITLGDLEAALSFWKDIPGEEGAKVLVFDKVAAAYLDRKDYFKALQVLLLKQGLLLDPALNDAVRAEVSKIVRGQLQERDLLALAKQHPREFPGDEALMTLISFYDTKGDFYREEREIKQFLSSFESHSFSLEARTLLGRIHDKIKSNRYLIGVVLPLSGKLAPFGLSALNGVELALRQFKGAAPGASVGLVVKDLEEEPPPSRSGVEGWLNEYHPVALVGPLLSKEVDRIVPIIEKEGLILITPGATSPRLTSLGQTVFRNAITAPAQCHAIAEYAVTKLNLKHFAILFPKESYGMEWVKCFSEETAKLGAETVDAESYPLNDTDFTAPIRRLKDVDLKKNGASEVVGARKKKEVAYSPGFDALFLPGDAQNIGLLIPQLVFHNIQDVVFLGAGGWNTPDFFRFVGPYAEGAVFVDVFFPGSADPFIRKFVAQYRAEFQQEPDLFAAQAFDAARMILAALEGGATTSREIRESLINLKNFPGASGLISEVRNGEMVKKPFLIQVQKGKFVQINPEEPPPLPAVSKEIKIP